MPRHPSPGDRLTPQVLQMLACAVLLGLVALAWTAGRPVAADDLLAPQPTPTPTLLPNSGGITGMTWEDLNGNTLREAGEPALPGVQLNLYSQSGQPPQTATSEADGRYRFWNLSPGFYQLAAMAPPGYRWTTPSTFNVYVSAGAVLTLDFGAQFVPTPTPTPTPIPRLDIDSAEFAYCGGIIQADTRAGKNNVWRYACEPSWDESGPELAYRIELGRSQPLTATLLTATADLDLFLLPSAYPETCLAAGDNYLTYQVQPGVYFLAVDGYQGAAGPFTLRLECPYGTQATPTPTPTPSRTPTPTATFTPGPTPSPTATRTPGRWYLPLLPRSYLAPPPTPEPVILNLQQGYDGYTGAADTTLNAWLPAQPFGADTVLKLRYNQQTAITTHMAPLLRFDLTLIPPTANIVTATLRLYLVAPPAHDLRAFVHGMLRPWDEATATWEAPGAGPPWAVPGAQGAGSDHMAWASDSQFVELGDRWYDFDVTELVRGWVANPATNYGLILLAGSGLSQANVEAGFASREHASHALRPMLSVRYWIATSR